MNSIDHFKKAVDAVGGQTRMGKLLGVRQQLVGYWLKSAKNGVPAQHCARIEEATGVSAHMIRPDVFKAPQEVAE